MQAEKPYIKLYYSIQKNILYPNSRKFTEFEAWIDILLLAKQKDDKLLNDKEVINPEQNGEIIISENQLANRWLWCRNSVRKFLKLLQKEGMILRQFSNQNRAKIIVCKFDYYQNNLPTKCTTKSTTKCTTKSTAKSTAKKEEKTQAKTDPENSNSDLQKAEENGEKPKVKDLYQRCCDIYNDFCLQRTSCSGVFDNLQCNSLKTIITYLSKNVKNQPPTDNDIYDALKLILDKYDLWDDYHKKQLKLSQINSNLINIINCIRNGKFTKSKSELRMEQLKNL